MRLVNPEHVCPECGRPKKATSATCPACNGVTQKRIHAERAARRSKKEVHE